jgi:hypothetical protein
MFPFACLLRSAGIRSAIVIAIACLASAQLAFAQTAPQSELPAAAAAPPPTRAAESPTQSSAPAYPVDPAYPAYPMGQADATPPAYAPVPYPPAAARPAQQAYPADWQQPTLGRSASAAPAATAASSLFAFGAVLGSSVVSESESTSLLLSPLLDGAVALDRRVLLRARWGLTWAVDGQGLGESTVRSANPMLSGVFHTLTGPWRIWAELGVTAPLAHVPLGNDGRLYRFSYNQTMALWGMWNQWFWTPDRMAIPIHVTVGYAWAGGHRLVLEAAEATLIGVRGSASGSNTVGQFALEAQLPVSPTLAFCPRWQTVRLPSGGQAAGLDVWQSALGIRARLATNAGTFFGGVLVNLDEPVGIFGGTGRWGLQLGKEIDP